MEDKIKQYAKEIEDSIRSEAQQYIESSVNEIIDDAIDKLKKLKKNSKRSTDQLLARIKELETNLEREVGHRASLIEELMLSDERNKENLNKLHTLQLKCNMLEKQVAKPTTAISLPASTNNTFEKSIAEPVVKDAPPVPSRPCQFCGKQTRKNTYCSDECRRGAERIQRRALEMEMETEDSKAENEEPKVELLPTTSTTKPVLGPEGAAREIKVYDEALAKAQATFPNIYRTKPKATITVADYRRLVKNEKAQTE